MEVSILQLTTGSVSRSNRKSLMNNLVHVRLIPKATTGQIPNTILNILLQSTFILTNHNGPISYQLQGNATELTSTYKSHSHNPPQAMLSSGTENTYSEIYYLEMICPISTTGYLLPVTEVLHRSYSYET
jgi:hypothetical protein